MLARSVCALVPAALVLVLGPAARAQEPPTADPAAVARVANRLNCPICQGYTLRDCPLEVCAQMRAEIGRRMAEGEAEDAVVAAFVDLYGPAVLNEPPQRGFALLAWLAPIAVVALAGFGALLRARARPTAQTTLQPAPPPGYAERVEAMARADDR